MQKLTLEGTNKTFKEEKKNDIMQIIACSQTSEDLQLSDF